MSTRFLTEDEILELLKNVGGGVNLATSTTKNYLIGHLSTTGTGVKDLKTNDSVFMQNGNLCSNGKTVINSGDAEKLVTAYSKLTSGYMTFGTVKICWGQYTIARNSSANVYFNSSFSGTPYQACCSWDNPTTGHQENFGITYLSSSYMTIVNGDGSTRLFYYIAIGSSN